MKHRILKTILTELHAQRDDDGHYGGYVDDERPDDVCLDGWFNIEKLAERIRDAVMENS